MSTTVENMLPVDYPMSALPSAVLAALPTALAPYFDHAAALVSCIGNMAGAEMYRRQENSVRDEESRLPPPLMVIDFNLWSDFDVGAALLVLQGLSKTENPEFGELVDSMHDLIASVAVVRLKESADPRNDEDYETRLANLK